MKSGCRVFKYENIGTNENVVLIMILKLLSLNVNRCFVRFAKKGVLGYVIQSMAYSMKHARVKGRKTYKTPFSTYKTNGMEIYEIVMIDNMRCKKLFI
jgi:hypothetical protein